MLYPTHPLLVGAFGGMCLTVGSVLMGRSVSSVCVSPSALCVRSVSCSVISECSTGMTGDRTSLEGDCKGEGEVGFP